MSDMARSRGRVGGAVRVLLLAVVVMLATAFGVSMATSGHWLWSIERVTDPTAGDTAVHASARYRAMRLERVAVAEQVLGRRAEALLSGDEQAYLRVLSSGAARLRTTQERIFENLQGVPFDSWSYRVVDVRLPVQGHETAVADTFTAHVEAKYRIDGADLGAVGRGRMMTFTRQGTDWVISADQAVVGTPSDPWDLGPVDVVRGDRTTVLVPAGGVVDIDVEALVTEADQAADRVDRYWGTNWPRRSVLYVPTDQRDMARMLGRSEQAGLAQIAAVTTGEVGVQGSGTKDQAGRIIINPASYRQLGGIGREVILTHELVHVATRASNTAAVPVWLSEGFADYIAYQETGLAPSAVADSAISAVKSGTVPDRLPDRAEFDPRLSAIDPAYAQSWLVVRLIAEQWSHEALLAVYTEVSSPAGAVNHDADTRTEQALRHHLGIGTEELTEQWRDQLRRLAAS